MSFSTHISDVAHFINDRSPWNPRNHDPEWLRSLQGDSPLLGRSELEYIAKVRHNIIEIAKPNRTNSPSDQRLRNKLSVAKNNFEEIVKYLRESSDSKTYFVSTYPSWRKFRDMSILQLKDIAKAININYKESAATRGGGSTLSLFGGLISLVPGLGIFRLAGGVLMGLGSLATIAASYVEYEEFQKKIKQAEKIMLDDREYSEKLWDWMNDFSHLDEAYKKIQEMDPDLRNVASVLHDFFKTKKITPGKNDVKRDDKGLIMTIEKVLVCLKFSSKTIGEIADIISMFLTTFMLYDRYRTKFNLALETYKFKNMLYISGNAIATTSQITSLINAGKSSNLSGFKKTRFGIGMALNVITIIQACNDMDSTSKEAVEIEKVTQQLKKEEEIFERIYDAAIRMCAD